jgi:hypothetical protein
VPEPSAHSRYAAGAVYVVTHDATTEVELVHAVSFVVAAWLARDRRPEWARIPLKVWRPASPESHTLVGP